MAEEDLIVSVEGDENQEQQTGNDAVEDLKSQFAKVEAERKVERERAEAAERRAAQAAQDAGRWQREAQSAHATVADRELDAIVSGIAGAQAEAEAAQKEFEAAAESGNFKAQGEAQRKIARAEAKIGRLDEAKADIEVRRSDTSRQRAERTDSAPPRQADRGDPVESFISSRTSETQAWLRAHPNYARAMALDAVGTAGGDDIKRARKLGAAHQDALAEGYTADTPEYFKHIESFVGVKKEPTHVDTQQNGSGERQRRSSPPAAPVSTASGAGSGGSRNGTDVSLTKHEAAAATDGTVVWNIGSTDPKTGKVIQKGDPRVGEPIGTYEMARRKLAMQKEGRYSADKYNQ